MHIKWTDTGEKEYHKFLDVSPLAPGAAETKTDTAGPLWGGDRGVFATADYYGAVTESNESNNSKMASFTVWGLPDLVVSLSYDVMKDPFGHPMMVRLYAQVTNNGPGDAPASVLYYSCSLGTSVHWEFYRDTPALTWGASSLQIYYLNWYEMPAGHWICWAKADGKYGTVKEWNETNNVSNIVYIDR